MTQTQEARAREEQTSQAEIIDAVLGAFPYMPGQRHEFEFLMELGRKLGHNMGCFENGTLEDVKAYIELMAQQGTL